MTTAITGALGSQSGLQVASNTLAPYAAATFGHNGSDPNQAAQLLSHAILGATLAYVNGGNAAGGAVSAAGSEAAAIYLTQTLYKDQATDENGVFDPNRLPEKDKEHIRNLTAAIGAVAGGIAGDSSLNAQIVGVVGQNAVENNWLSAKEVNRLVELDRACSKGDGKACKGYLELRKLDRERDLRLLAACQQPSSTACRNLKAQANIANASLASGYFDPVLHPELWSDKEKASAHKKEYSDTDAVLRLSEGWTPEQIMREAALLNATRTVLADLTIVGTIKDFKEADTLADYATAIILAAPGLKQADTLKHARDFTRAYKAAKEAGDLKAAKEIIQLARTAEKSPNNLAKLAVKEKEIQAASQLAHTFHTSRSQLQQAFKHAKDFGIVGNANNATLSEFNAAIRKHILAPNTKVVQGTYRGQPVTHFVDPNSGLNVMCDSSGNFLSGWKLNPVQLMNVTTRGSL